MTSFTNRERRSKDAQRATVEQVLATARGRASVVPAAGSEDVYVYDELRSGPRPGTRRFRIDAEGRTAESDFLPF